MLEKIEMVARETGRAWRDSLLSASEAAALLLIVNQYFCFPERPFGARQKIVDLIALQLPIQSKYVGEILYMLKTNLNMKLPEIESLLVFFATRALTKQRPGTQRSLVHWLTESWDLVPTDTVPSAREMLTLQADGKRYVTLITENIFLPIGHRTNAFEFLIHDLEHADRFFGTPAHHNSQVGFFRILDSWVKSEIPWPFPYDSKFDHDFEYLMADMNTHWFHQIQYLKAIAIDAKLRSNSKEQLGNPGRVDIEDFFEETFSYWGLEKTLSNKLSSDAKDLTSLELAALEKFFRSRGLGKSHGY